MYYLNGSVTHNLSYLTEDSDSRGGSEPRLELFFRLEVNKLKAQARSSLILKSSIELFSVKNSKFSIQVCRARQKLELNFRLEVNKTKAR